jgi:putative oxidoreductase
MSTSPTTAQVSPDAPPGLGAGLLLLRLAVGLTMAAHGCQKLFGWFDGAGLDGTGMWFESVGYPSGRTFALVAGVTETFGGLALALGLLTPLAAAAILGTMLNAVAVTWGEGFLAGYEYELILAVAAAALALTGPGRYAVDRLVPPLRAPRPAVGAAALALALLTAGVVLLIRN